MVADSPETKRQLDKMFGVESAPPQHRFAFGQKVIADNDGGNPMSVVGVLYRAEGATEFECAYWCNGDHKLAWLPAWRLSPKPE